MFRHKQYKVYGQKRLACTSKSNKHSKRTHGHKAEMYKQRLMHQEHQCHRGALFSPASQTQGLNLLLVVTSTQQQKLACGLF